MRRERSLSGFREQVDELFAKGFNRQAYCALASRTLSMPPFHEFSYLAEKLAQSISKPISCRLGILSTFTIDPIREVLKSFALVMGIDASVYFGGFGQLEQEVMTTQSGLGNHKPQVIVFAWRLQDVSPTLWESFLELRQEDVASETVSVLARAETLLEACKAHYPEAKVLIHSFVAPPIPALGAIDLQHSNGQQQVIGIINAGLVDLCARTPGAYLVDCASVSRRSGPAWFDARHWYTASAPLAPAALTELALEYVKYLRALAGKTKKVLVLDLDNTLWGGILGEDGLDGIALGTTYPGNCYLAFQRQIKQLSRRGVVLAINSKNNESDVREVFEKNSSMVLGWDDFASVRINWQDKVQNMSELSAELSLGLDSFVFVDDNPYELEMIHQQMPELTTVQVPKEPSELPELLSRLAYFDSVIYSEEDRKRAGFYHAQAQRVQFQRSVGDIESFYRSLQMHLKGYKVQEAQIPRVAQLTQRTNQFNMTTRRYSESDVGRFVSDPATVVWSYRLVDRFGDNGIIGVVIAKQEGKSWLLDTFLLSCRVIGRTVETAILALVADEARKAGATALEGEFIPTKKNAPAREVFAENGFERTEEDDSGRSLWRLELTGCPPKVPAWFVVESA